MKTRWSRKLFRSAAVVVLLLAWGCAGADYASLKPPRPGDYEAPLSGLSFGPPGG